MHPLLIITHITIGFLGLLISVYAVFAVLIQKSSVYRRLSKIIAAMAIVEIASGLGLVFMQFSEGALVHYCVRIGLYLLVVGAVEGLLVYKQKETSRTVYETA